MKSNVGYLGPVRHSHLDVSVDEVVKLEVVVVLAEWIDERLRHFEPPDEEHELEDEEEGRVEVERLQKRGNDNNASHLSPLDFTEGKREKLIQV